jgi:hypothetical protein
MNKAGTVIIPADLNVWDHELKSAQALAAAGYTVEFLPASNEHQAKSPDILMDGLRWEIKSPKTDKLSAVERNLKRASKQSASIIIDTRRMKKIHDATIQKFLIQKLKQQKSIKQLLMVNRKHQVIDIHDLI